MCVCDLWDEEQDVEQELQALPEAELEQPGPCCICGTPDCPHACFHCGKPVCMDLQNYQEDSSCGGWILDWWTDGADDPDDGNEFWCQDCLEAVAISRRASAELDEPSLTLDDFGTEEELEAWCEEHPF